MPIENEQHDANLDDVSPEGMQRIIQIGEHASQMLGSPVYNMMYRQRLDRTFQEWLVTSPKEQNKREGLWHEAQGLISLTADMGAAAQDAQRVLQKQQAQNDPQQNTQNYLDTQGFGLN
jgi:hypothetical protein